jgi:hypothetical protein
MNSRDADNARFEELMAQEFPDGLIPADRARLKPDQPTADPDAPPAPVEAAQAEVDPPSGDSGFRSWAPPDEPEVPFVPPPRPPARRWTAEGISGAVLVVVPVLLVLIAAAGVRLPAFVSTLAGLGFIVGVALLLHRLRKRPPVDGDGAVI